jgi:hypothetical protein
MHMKVSVCDPRWLVAVFTLSLSVTASGEDDVAQRREAWLARMHRLSAIEKRINETRPERRNGPLRYENITDSEVREVQSVAKGIVPDAIVNISGVVTGCPCEEGSACSDQVWILATNDKTTVGLQLSKIEGHWKIGPIQDWWFQYESFKAKNDKLDLYTFHRAEEVFKETFPACLNSTVAAPK